MELTAEELQYYSRQMILSGWGNETQLKLKKSSVLVVGAGALGCAILQNLCRSGVGKITVCDFDTVSASNLQRQILFDKNDVGKKKVLIAKKKLQSINPNVDIESFDIRVNHENILTLMKKADVIVDGTDNFATKYLLNDACIVSGKPLVFGAIEGFSGQVSVFNYNEGATYRCLFPETPDKEHAVDCNTIGVTATLPQIIGNIQANEVIKIITGIGEVLSGRLLMVDMRSNNFMSVSYKLIPENRKVEIKPENYRKDVCAVVQIEALNADQISASDRLVDVRGEEEHKEFNIGGENIPLYRIDEAMEEFSKEKRIVTYCNGGLAAKQAALLISSKKNLKVYYLDSPLESFRKS